MLNHPKILALLKSLGFIALYLLFGALLSQFKGWFPPQFERYAQGILGTVGAMLAVLVFLKAEKKTLKDYGLMWEKSTFKKFFLGLGMGLVAAGVLVFTQIGFSNLQLTFNTDINLLAFFLWSLAFVPLAFMEEVAFRSYPLLKLNEAFGFRITQIILAILFAVYHMLMMWNPQTAILGPGIWALAYALTAVIYKGIAVPTGLHFGLNFIQSLIGGQEGIEPIWLVDFQEKVSESAIVANEQFGVALQIFILIICVIATEVYILKNRQLPSENQQLTSLKKSSN